MSIFRGYFLKAVNSGEIFPNKYIQIDSWESNPKAREEIKAYRDENTRDLTRITASGTKSKWSFTTMPYLHLADKMAIQDFFVRNESDHLARRITLEYWNDESNQYEVADFYRPDTQFKIYEITSNDIIYDEFKVTGVEY